MIKTQIIYCPNCGARATRSIIDNSIKRTSCESCDYLLVQCAKTGKVIEAYAPGINSYCAINATPV
ncbi:MAG TPA: replication restart DNA helicase PriA [Coleofasciculaceae cyanobacterium]